jgi:hypothetical protein
MVFNPKTMKPKKNTSTAEFSHPRNSAAHSPFITDNFDAIESDYQKPKVNQEKGYVYTGKSIPEGNN